MDPELDYQQIWVRDLVYEFPWDLGMSHWLAFYNTIAPAGMAAMLARTGELTGNTQRRLDHMSCLMWEMNLHGFTHPRGRAAVRQMNRIHTNVPRYISDERKKWTITNDQFLFVLATTMITPQRWLDRFGWRRISASERRASYLFFHDMATHMGLHDIPESYEAFERFHDEYRAKHFQYSPEAAELWAATRPAAVEVLVFWLPARLQPPARRIAARVILPALLSEHQRRAFGVPRPWPSTRLALSLCIRARSAYVRLSRPRTDPATPELLPTVSFPQGDYVLEKLGPAHSV